jgi:hypothetical protein
MFRTPEPYSTELVEIDFGRPVYFELELLRYRRA